MALALWNAFPQKLAFATLVPFKEDSQGMAVQERLAIEASSHWVDALFFLFATTDQAILQAQRERRVPLL